MNWTTDNEGRADPRSRDASRAALGLHQGDGGHRVSRGNSIRLEPPEEARRRVHLGVIGSVGLVAVAAVMQALGIPVPLLF
jgi:hypothetical protein